MSLASAGLGAIGGIAKIRQGRQMQDRAQSFIDDFQWQELQNVHDGRQVSTMSADLQREEMARNTATMVQAARNGGSRGIANLGKIQQNNITANRQIGADLDKQRFSIDRDRAQDQTVVRAMTEKRQADELQGYGQMLNVGMQMKQGGFSDMLNGFMGAALGIGGGEEEDGGGLFNRFKVDSSGISLTGTPKSLNMGNKTRFNGLY